MAPQRLPDALPDALLGRRPGLRLAEFPGQLAQLCQGLRQPGRHALQLLGAVGLRILQHAAPLGTMHQTALRPGAQAGVFRADRRQGVQRALAQLRRRLVPRQRRDPAQPGAFQVQRVGQRGRALVHGQRDRAARDPGAVEAAADALQGRGPLAAVGDVAGIDMVHQAQAVRGIQRVAEADLAQVVAFLLVAAALGERVAVVAGSDPRVEVGRVAGQHALADEVPVAEGLQQAVLGGEQLVVGLGLAGLGDGGDVDGVEAVPEGLGGEAPQAAQDGALVLGGDFGLGAGVADAVKGGEQEELGEGGALARQGPHGVESGLDAGVPGGLPEGAGEAEVEGLGFDGVGGGLLLEGGEDAVHGAEVGLVDGGAGR